MARRKLTLNSAKCKACGAVLVSTYVHDWVCCNCRTDEGKWEGSGGIFVDGGLEYQRYGGDLDNFIDLSEGYWISTPCVECSYFTKQGDKLVQGVVSYCYWHPHNGGGLPVIIASDIGPQDIFKGCPMPHNLPDPEGESDDA